MKTVTFLINYDHPLNETQHAGYLAGQTLEVTDAVADRAIGLGRAKIATKAEANADDAAEPDLTP